ncbi:MAG: carbon-nitrogen hydrolase family protein [Desulfurococcales archaeon]|nr:carbon-nitrogen hydrolase family protein [Desulfurococcales archaeon]
MDEELVVSVLQMSASRTKAEALEKLKKLVSEARGDIIVMPEYAMVDPTDLDPETLYKTSETLDGSWVNTLRNVAREKGSCVIGTLFEKSPEPPRVYNTAVLIDPNGDVISVYRKTHLFDILGYRESEKILAGEELFEPVELCGARVGLAICFEIRYPELFRLQAEKGVDVFFIPSAWYTGHLKEETYRVLAQARAHENVSYVIGAILYGERFTGRSLVVDPYGVVVAEAGIGEKVLEAVLDGRVLMEARSKLPLLELRRRDLYGLVEKR